MLRQRLHQKIVLSRLLKEINYIGILDIHSTVFCNGAIMNVSEACLDLDCHKINKHHHCSKLKYLINTATFTKLSRLELRFEQN